jgi:hypothetical protein
MIPRVRHNGIVIRRVDDKVVVFDKGRKETHRLSRTTSRVWDLTDGERSITEIAAALDVDERVVTLALDELASMHLLDPGYAPPVSRRSAVLRVAAAAAVGLGIPAITTFVARIASEIQSGKPSKLKRRYRGKSPPGR